MQKEYRNMKVCEQSGYKYKATPTIILKGQWLEELGFNIGDPLLVKCEDGKLIITPDAVKMEMLEAEKAFMEQESKKLKEEFRKKHRELMASYVAERTAAYNMVAKAGTEV